MTTPKLSSGAERRDARADEMVYHPELKPTYDGAVVMYWPAQEVVGG